MKTIFAGLATAILLTSHYSYALTSKNIDDLYIMKSECMGAVSTLNLLQKGHVYIVAGDYPSTSQRFPIDINDARKFIEHQINKIKSEMKSLGVIDPCQPEPKG